MIMLKPSLKELCTLCTAFETAHGLLCSWSLHSGHALAPNKAKHVKLDNRKKLRACMDEPLCTRAGKKQNESDLNG